MHLAEGWFFLIVFGLALTTALLSVPLLRFVSLRLGIVSQPGGRRREGQPMPKLGGIAIFMGFTLAVLVAQSLPIPRHDAYEIIRLIGLLLGGFIILLVGLIDDWLELNFFWQAIGQMIACAVAISFQIFIESFNNPLTGQLTERWPHLVTVTLSLFWLGLMINTVNFLDGLDGLAAGVAFIASSLLFINGAFIVTPAQTSVSLLPLALMGASLGFLLFNFYPAQVYMGGSALYLGYLLATLSIIGGAKMATILLVMGLPLMDLAWQAVSRLRRGQNPFSGDRGHLHFRLLDSGILSHRQIVIFYYLFCALFGGLTLLLESELYKFIAFGVMLTLIMLGFALVTRLQTLRPPSPPSLS